MKIESIQSDARQWYKEHREEQGVFAEWRNADSPWAFFYRNTAEGYRIEAHGEAITSLVAGRFKDLTRFMAIQATIWLDRDPVVSNQIQLLVRDLPSTRLFIQHLEELVLEILHIGFYSIAPTMDSEAVDAEWNRIGGYEKWHYQAPEGMRRDVKAWTDAYSGEIMACRTHAEEESKA